MAGDLADRSLGRIHCHGRDEFGQPAGVDPYLPLVNRLERPVGQPHRWGGFHQAVVGLAQGHHVAQGGRAAELPGRDVVHVAVPHRHDASGKGAPAVAERDRQP